MTLSTQELAQAVGVHRDTVLRWTRVGLLPPASRDHRGWRVFDDAHVQAARLLAVSGTAARLLPEPSGFRNLEKIDWDFVGERTDYLTHGIHPYPAKFIPQIPNALIQELSSVGETVLDVFCGSGTTLLEALLLRRNAIGIDANPLACLISRAKTAVLDLEDFLALESLAQEAELMSRAPCQGGLQFDRSQDAVSVDKRIAFWFEPFIIEELSRLRTLCQRLPTSRARDLADCAFSSIIVSVSKQDSDTRYVRRAKNLSPGDAFDKFVRALRSALQRSRELASMLSKSQKSEVIEADVRTVALSRPVDLLVCSPPYPNAYSYHLYHMTRMVWLGMDQPKFRREEIGSHRKYSSKSRKRETAATFADEIRALLGWVTPLLRPGGHAVFVVGNSTINGETIQNDQLICSAGLQTGLVVQGVLRRRMSDARKSFNPRHGRIKEERIVVLRKDSA